MVGIGEAYTQSHIGRLPPWYYRHDGVESNDLCVLRLPVLQVFITTKNTQ